jgi:hypothetical protein
MYVCPSLDCCFSGVARCLLDNFVFLPRCLCARPWDCDNGYGLHYSICCLHIALRISHFFPPSTLADPRSVGRALRNGKKYAEFINNAIVVGVFAVHDMITRHASGPQDESDADSNGEDDDDFDTVATSPARSPTSSQPTPPAQPATGSQSLPLLTLLRQRWQLSSPSPLPQSAPAILTHKEKKKTRNRTAHAIKRDTIHSVPGCYPEAIALKRAQQSTPIPVDFHFPSHPGVSSTGWMGTHEREAEFEPEARAYSSEEAQRIPGMRVVDNDGSANLTLSITKLMFAQKARPVGGC